jgi:hypothetical protein
MARKTKKEKIISQFRKQLMLLQVQQKSPPLERKDVNPQVTKAIETPLKDSLSEKDWEISSYFVKDLKKSLVLITAIIALEFFLYFATINHYLRLF